MNYSRKLFYIFLFAFLTLSGFVFAQKQLEIDYPEIGGWKPTEIAKDVLPNYVNYIFNFSIAISGLIAFIVLIYSGVRYMASVGNPTIQKDAKGRIFSALLGILILLSSYLILTSINPRLIFIELPFQAVETPEVVQPPAPGIEPLIAQEIPLGRLTESALETKKINKIKEVTKETKETAEDLKKLSEELKSLTEECKCGILDRGTCDPGGCGGNCGCTSHCACTGDPCPNRDQINEKISDIENKIGELESLLEDTQEKNKESGLKELKGITEEDLKNLLLAEELMNKCNFTPWSYDNLLSLRETQEVEIKKLDQWKDLKIGGDPTTFYCLSPIGTLESSSPILKLSSLIKNLFGGVEKASAQKEYICGLEIPIGETIDNTQTFLKKLIIEIKNIIDFSTNEIESAENLIKLPDQCTSAGCSNEMRETGSECCAWECCGCCSCPSDDKPPEGPQAPSSPSEESRNWDWLLTLFNIQVAYACSCGCCAECCVYSCCTACECTTCHGDPCPTAEISNQLRQIQDFYSKIENAYKEIIDLFEKKDIAVIGKTKKERIIDKLIDSRYRTARCVSPLRDIEEIASGEQNTKWLWACNQAKEQELVEECYGPSGQTPDQMNNFICCE